MAQISLDSIKRIEKYRNTIHDKVYTTYTAFEADGEKYVQIDTYGRIGRENPEKISQSFQFDRATAEVLVNLLREEFGLQELQSEILFAKRLPMNKRGRDRVE